MDPKLHVANVKPFDVDEDPTSTLTRWKKWIAKFEIFFTAMKIEDKKQQRAMLLHFAGDRVYDIFETLEDTGDDYAAAKAALTAHFAPSQNKDYAIYTFRQSAQGSETTDQYATRLRQLAANCDFHDVDSEIKAQIIQTTKSARLRRKALREPDLTLKTLLDAARAVEISEIQAKGMEGDSSITSDVNAVQKTRKKQKYKSQTGNQTCRYCGKGYPHKDGKRENCPAYGKTCNYCRKQNHFAKCCKARQQGQNEQRNAPTYRNVGHHQSARYVDVAQTSTPVTVDDSDSEGYSFTVGICKPVNAANTEIIDRATFEVLKQRPKLMKTGDSIVDYGQNTHKLLGKFTV